MRALVYERNVPRFAAARVASTLGSGRGAAVGPLRLLDTDGPELPGQHWFRLRPTLSGICGSDLATIDGRSSRSFEDIVSFPFVPGHEVVGTLEDGGIDHAGRTLAPGTRAVIEPVLGCAPRELVLCPACAAGDTGSCGRVAFGALAPGLQTGFCADTGGGWSTAGLVAHASQIHAVPEALSDEAAVMVEPTACGIHAAFRAGLVDGEVVAVLGAGTLGLAATAALAAYVRPATGCTIVMGAKHGHQRRAAEQLGADVVVPPDQLPRALRQRTGSLVVGGRLTEGADVVLDCVGSAESLTAALAMVRSRGRVVLVGMPSRVSVDLAPLWLREIALVGAYAYGTEPAASAGPWAGPGAGDGSARPPRTFALALDLVARAGLGDLVSARYPLDRYQEALAHAGAAGRRGATKIVFDLHARSGRPLRSAARKGSR